MAYPPAYNRAYSFTDFETLNPGVPKPGDKLDTEYDAVSNALTGTQTALALIQRADGALANESVGVDQLQAGLFDGIGDAATADAEAAAAAASASAAAAATSAAAAAASETSAATDAGVAAGSAAQAGVSQGIAQDAANEAALSATDADNSADVSVQAANDTAGSVAACEAHVERAFEWAELLTGPVLPAPPGWPEAVDDGMFSSKWWAIRARDFNSVTTIDLGTAGADIGEAFDIWDAVPGNDLGVGLTYATWGTPVQTYVLVDRGNPSDPTSWVNITGGPGPAGPPNTLTIGTVTTGAVGQPAAATITGAAPDQVLNLTLPTGATGPQGVIGPAGPPNALAIGTVTTGAAGSPAAATITGTSPTQTLNLTIPQGVQGVQGIQGIQGIQGVPGDDMAALAADSHVTGDWLFDATQWFAYTAPEVASIKAGTITGIWVQDGLDGIHAKGRIKLLRPAANPVFSFIRTNGTVAVPLPINAAEVLGTLSALGVYNTGGFTRPGAEVRFVATANWTDTENAGSVEIRAVPPGATLVVPAAVFRGDRIDFGNATNNPPYNFLGTGLATFGGQVQVNGDRVTISNTDVLMELQETDAPLNEKIWRFRATSSQFNIGTRLDTGAAGQDIFRATRVAAAVFAIYFGNPTDNPVYNFLGTGLTTFNGPVVLQGAITPRLGFLKIGNFTYYIGGDGTASNDFTIGLNAGIFVRINTVGQMMVGVGDAGAPTYSFIGDPDTGMYGTGADGIRFATGGVVRAALASTAMNFLVPLRGANGSAAAPQYSFDADDDTGMYRSGADLLDFAAGGVQIARFYGGGLQMLAANTVIYAQDGAAAAPGYAFQSGPNTGMYRTVANEVAFATAGVRRVVIFPGGLQLDTGAYYAPDGTVALPGYAFSADADTGIYRSNPNSLAFTAGGIFAGAFGIDGSGGAALYLPTGSAALPALSFLGDGDTGIYRLAADMFGFVTGGVRRAYVYNGGFVVEVALRAVDGAAGSPSYTFDNDTNTGFYSQAADIIGCTSGGSLVASIHNSGITAASFTTSSSRAVKRETGAPSKPANILARLRPIMYRLLAGGDNEQLGLIAEEVQEVCPQLSDGKTVAYDRLAILLLAAWQDEHMAEAA